MANRTCRHTDFLQWRQLAWFVFILLALSRTSQKCCPLRLLEDQAPTAWQHIAP